ncbi:MAG TPA: isocitrate lyase/PEP mutase family protein [Caulobacteraceae bacterium]|jgi:methylisocitrate lyase|nr:isocitrate lyase/PEP mutase family protein [Caulobacteraceae bacterium]
MTGTELDIPAVRRKSPTWKEVLDAHRPLILPAAHDALTAKLIERAGFPAYQVGGFALVGARYGRPDLDLEHFGDKSHGVRDIIEACPLPVLVDGDDGYGDAKNVTRTVRGYEALGASAIFIEDQTSPKRCGHMAGKSVVPMEAMVSKVKAAVAARQERSTFILARTDALEPEGVDGAIRRAEAYLEAGADGAYVEGPRTVEELERVGRALRNVPLATSVLERGGVTPALPPSELSAMGFSMILYPASVLFRLSWAIEQALNDLKAQRPLDPAQSLDMKQYEEVVEMQVWAAIETSFDPRPETKA